jgi:superfamily II DNA or RNA helicase
MATAAGKTVCAILDVEGDLRRSMHPSLWDPKHPSETDGEAPGDSGKQAGGKPFRLVFLVHSMELARAACSKFKKHFGPGGIGFPAAAFVDLSRAGSVSHAALRRARFIFCLLQSFSRIPPDVLEGTTHFQFDEVHHLIAPTYMEVLRKCTDVASRSRHAYMLGMTATLTHRNDVHGEALRGLFKRTLYLNFPWIMAKKYPKHTFIFIQYCPPSHFFTTWMTKKNLRSNLNDFF